MHVVLDMDEPVLSGAVCRRSGRSENSESALQETIHATD